MRHLIFISILFASCQYLNDVPLSIDWYDDQPVDTVVIPIDTTIVEDPDSIVILDTCETLIHYTDPAYTMLYTYFFNGTPLTFNWHYGSTSISNPSLIELLKQLYPQYTYTYYERNGGVSIIIDGISDPGFLEGKIWTYDLVGQRALLTTCERCLYFFGSATPDEAIMEAQNRLSTRSFHLLNTPDWTEAQETTFARANLHAEVCKHGEYWASFRESEVPQSLRDSFDLFLWQNTVPLWDEWQALIKS